MIATLQRLVPLALALFASFPAQEPVPAGTTAPRPAADNIAARGNGSVLSFDELDAVLLMRHAHSQTGKQALQHLVEASLLRVLAREAGVTIADQAVEARCRELEAEIIKSGQAENLQAYLVKSGVDEAEFREHLRLALVHEKLARRGLGIPDSRSINGEQLQNWLNATLTERGLTQVPAPWKDGIMVRCAGFVVTVDELLTQLRKDLPDEELRTLCYQTLLAKRVDERMPDLTPEARDDALSEEIERRRQAAALNPAYKGVPFEKILAAQGVDAKQLHLDPAVRVAAGAHLWVDRKYKDEDLRALYAEERDHFEQLFGEAVETWVIYLRAAEFKNDLNPRDFDDAWREAERLRENIKSLPQFQYEVRRSSEDRATRDNEGFWGWITRGLPQVDEAARQEIFDALHSGRYDPTSPPEDVKSRLLGPVRATNGVLLLWVGGRRPAPTWIEMRTHVHRELRRRFLEDLLPKNAVRTWRDN